MRIYTMSVTCTSKSPLYRIVIIRSFHSALFSLVSVSGSGTAYCNVEDPLPIVPPLHSESNTQSLTQIILLLTASPNDCDVDKTVTDGDSSEVSFAYHSVYIAHDSFLDNALYKFT